MGAVGGFPSAHLFDQLLKSGGWAERPEAQIPLQSGTDGVAD